MIDVKSKKGKEAKPRDSDHPPATLEQLDDLFTAMCRVLAELGRAMKAATEALEPFADAFEDLKEGGD